MDSRKLILPFMALTALSLNPLYAKKKPKPQIYDIPADMTENAQDATAETNQIMQPFSWVSAGDVLKYEIKIEQFNILTNRYEPYYEHETNEEETERCIIYIEPTLPPGKYRSTIKVYNILGILESGLTSQDEFLVRQAYKPEVRSVNYPLYMRSTIYLDDMDNNGVIEVEGRNLFELPETRHPIPDITATEYTLKSKKHTIEPEAVIQHDDRNRKVTLQFDMKKLDVGKYHLIAKDASGLHSEEHSSSEFSIKFKKWMDFDIEAGYACPIEIHDGTFSEFMGSKVFPLSGQARMSLLPFKHNWGYMGLGVRASYTRLINEQKDYTIDGNLGTAHLLFIYQIPVGKRRRFFFEVHGGGGVTYFNNIIYHFPHNITSEPLNTLSISFDGGAAIQFYPIKAVKRLYFELAGDYIFTNNKDMAFGMVLPSAGVGWQF